MADSIIQSDKSKCFICGQNPCGDPLDCHHCFGGANRDLSEKYGLKIYAHHEKCHIFGKMSIHQNVEVNKKVKAIAQKKAMEYYDWSVDDFRKIFGKNYL